MSLEDDIASMLQTIRYSPGISASAIGVIHGWNRHRISTLNKNLLARNLAVIINSRGKWNNYMAVEKEHVAAEPIIRHERKIKSVFDIFE